VVVAPEVSYRLHLADLSATAALGAALARALLNHEDHVRTGGFQLNLTGDLGAGKTSLVRAMLREMNVSGPIKSPTYALLEPYTVSSLDFYHFDFYRFADPQEFAASGFRELFGPGRVCAIEWPEKAGDFLPGADLTIVLTVDGEARTAALVATSQLGHACLKNTIMEYEARTAGG
jgi:tRNA threonylcarbamoyladenosine biosynthesis protein TsaE